MAVLNYTAALSFVWQPGFDDPADGYHVTPGDPGGGTKGGVIEATWARGVAAKIVSPGSLANATNEQLSAILRAFYWEAKVGDVLPSGLDILVFNGRMMSGRFPWLLQQTLGFVSTDVDGWIGPETLARSGTIDPKTLIQAVTGVHYAYLTSLPTWSEFGRGWAKRLLAAQALALSHVKKASA